MKRGKGGGGALRTLMTLMSSMPDLSVNSHSESCSCVIVVLSRSALIRNMHPSSPIRLPLSDSRWRVAFVLIPFAMYEMPCLLKWMPCNSNEPRTCVSNRHPSRALFKKTMQNENKVAWVLRSCVRQTVFNYGTEEKTYLANFTVNVTSFSPPVEPAVIAVEAAGFLDDFGPAPGIGAELAADEEAE